MKDLKPICYKTLLIHSWNPEETQWKHNTQKKHLEKYALKQLLGNYWYAPHPVTGQDPSSMWFRDDKQASFPRQPVPGRDIEIARE